MSTQQKPQQARHYPNKMSHKSPRKPDITQTKCLHTRNCPKSMCNEPTFYHSSDNLNPSVFQGVQKKSQNISNISQKFQIKSQNISNISQKFQIKFAITFSHSILTLLAIKIRKQYSTKAGNTKNAVADG